MMKRSAFVYLLRCADGSIYTGWTRDVPARVDLHQKGRGARYTRTHRPVVLIYQERLPSQSQAMRREAEIKRWPRARKLRLAEQALAPGGNGPNRVTSKRKRER